jgi:putative endonuclease
MIPHYDQPEISSLRMSAAKQELGRRGERIAEEWLVNKGWRVVERRFRSGHRDIDLVVERRDAEGRLIAFVEVKSRLSAGYGGPLGAVHWKKQREMARAARDWMSRERAAGDNFRFDVVGVLFGSGTPEIVHIENAFHVR